MPTKYGKEPAIMLLGAEAKQISKMPESDAILAPTDSVLALNDGVLVKASMATLANSMVARDANGNVTGLARSGSVTPLPILRSGKSRSVIGSTGLRPGSISAGSANTTWHQRTRARGSFYAIEVGVAALSGALTTYDHIAVAATTSAGAGTGVGQVTPDQVWNIGPAVVTPSTGNADTPAFASTGPIFCRSVPADDGKRFPFFDVRIHTVAGLPAYSNLPNLASVWSVSNPLWPVRCYSQGGDFVSSNQAGFTNTVANNIYVPAYLRIWYDEPGFTVLLVGDSTGGADSVLEGTAARNGYAFRAIRALQDAGYPFDLLNAAWSGNSFTGYNATLTFTNRAKALIDAVRPDVVIVPVYTPNDQCDTLAGVDRQWFFANQIAEYAKNVNAIPLFITPFPNNGYNATMDSYRKINRDRAMASNSPCLNVDPLVATGSPARWITGMNDNGDNTHPGALGHAVVATALASKLLEILY